MCRICRNDPRFFAQVSFVSVVCRSSDLSIHVQRISPRTNALLQPSLRAMTAPPMTGFHRAQIFFARKQCFRNTAIFRILPASVQSQIHRLRGAADSFHVRDSHPIPLFSEQACVSDCSGRAFATKAMLCNFRYNCSRFLRIKLRKARFLRETLHKEFPLFSPKTGTTPLKKLLFFS